MESPAEFYHKIEVVYLLSQGPGQADHPHMIQVQYPSHQKFPTLRDVKSRLTALRGRGMPDSYAWSYKRSYKGTFIWCDVFDDDVIHPLGQSGEYVLKALEVFDGSQDSADREAEHPCQEVDQTVMRILPVSNESGAAVTTLKERIKSNGLQNHINVHNLASQNCSESIQKSFGDSAQSGIKTKAWRNEHTDACTCSAGAPVSAPEDIIENKRCLEKLRRSQSSTSISGTNSSAGTQTEPFSISDCNSDVSSFERNVKFEVKDAPSKRSSASDESSRRAFPVSEFFRKGPVKSRTWVVKEEDVSVPIHVGTSRRSSDESHERVPVVPPSPVVRPCFPGHPLMFMLKKAARFHRSQLCRRVEVVETFRALPLEEPNFSRYTSKKRHGNGSKKVDQRPHFSKIVTLKSKPQRNKISSEEPGREGRTLSDFIEPTKSRSLSERMVSEGSRDVASARHNRADSMDAYHTTRCREVVVGLKVGSRSERVPREDEKGISDLKSLVNPELKSFKMVSKSTARHASKPGIVSSSSLFIAAPAEAVQLPTVSKPQEIPKERALKQHRSQVAGFIDIPTRDEGSVVGENVASIPQDLKTLKVARNVSNNCYFSLPTPAAEKKISDTKVYPTRESSVFGSAALHSDNTQEVKVVNPKLDVQAAPATETSCPEGVQVWPKDSSPKHRAYKGTREERPLTPGLTELHWEGLLQEAVVHSQPPKDLILHECLRCGRTFKPDSLKVHLRGCHIINKPKPSLVLRKKVSL